MKVTAIDRLQSYKSVVTQNYNNLMALAQRQFALSMVQSGLKSDTSISVSPVCAYPNTASS